LSLNAIAARVGWDKTRLSKYENDHIGMSVSVIAQIARAMDLSPLAVIIDCLRCAHPDLTSESSKAGTLLNRLADEAKADHNARAAQRRKPKATGQL